MDSLTVGGARAFEVPKAAELAPWFPQLELMELIGHGGMGAVYKARQKDLDRVVALKILPSALGDIPGFAERFSREAKAMAKLNHPGIVMIHDFGQVEGLFYFLMEFVDGVNLSQLLSGGRVSPREALAIVPQICDALQFAHDHGIVHRDIKPANILLDRRGRVKVADFGIAKLVAGYESPLTSTTGDLACNTLTGAGRGMGTPNYMAPEQSERPDEVDHRADIYALGVVFYQMLTGELPQDRITPPSRKVLLDVRLDEIVLRTLEERADLRYQQASDLKTAVETIAEHAPSAAPSGKVFSRTEGTGRGPRLNVRKLIFRFSLGAAAIVGGGVWWWSLLPLDGTARRNAQFDLSKPNPWRLYSRGEAGSKSGFESWHATRVALVDNQTGELTVKSADGRAFGIIAVASAGKPDIWWRPNGGPLPKGAYQVKTTPDSGEDHYLLFDCRCLQGGVASPTFEPVGSLVSTSSVGQNGTLLPDVWAIRVRFHDSTRIANCRTEARMRDWHLVSVFRPNDSTGIEVFSGGGLPDFKAGGWDDPVNTDEGIQIGVDLKYNIRFWETAIIAVDKNGNSYRGKYASEWFTGMRKFRGFTRLPIAPSKIWGIPRAEPQLKLADVRIFRAMVSPTEIIEFRNIALQPWDAESTLPQK